MAKGAWDKFSLIAYLLAEPHRDSEEREVPYCPNDFHPLRPGLYTAEQIKNVGPYNPAVLEYIQNMNQR